MDVSTFVRITVVSFLCYVAILFVLRLSGKRTLVKMSAFDFIVTVSLGTVFGNILINQDEILWEGLYIFCLLLIFQYLSSFLSSRYTLFSRLLKAHPTLLFYDGTYYEHKMVKERIPKSEVLQAIREQGIGRTEEVAAVILETDGKLSVLPKKTNEMKNLNTLTDLEENQ
ncbi:MAG: DUF421 domain-containing protein [Alkalibacterium sp.]|nr:DUF421 domain-containing protein [Alkalibacterium sp.]